MPINKDKLASVMIDKQINISDLSEKSNVSKSQLSRIVNGKTKNVGMSTLGKISKALEINYQDILDEEKEKQTND